MTSAEIESLYREHGGRLTALAWRILRSLEDAREVCQETFARLLRSSRDGAEIVRPAAWISRTAINLSVERLRKRRPPPARAGPAPTPESETRRIVDEAVRALPERQRIVFLLRHEQGMPVAEIAEALGVAPSTIGVHLTRALRALQERLGPRLKETT
ncbi:MAG: sigma-70 family RNA polymerase sigma factor [Planctomycetes bacterium]|nr:sigma-70 family RNA polymerase sigma factor [Planctomycetota bacterium]